MLIITICVAGGTLVFLIFKQGAQITALQESLHRICSQSLNEHMNAQGSDNSGAGVDQAHKKLWFCSELFLILASPLCWYFLQCLSEDLPFIFIVYLTWNLSFGSRICPNQTSSKVSWCRVSSIGFLLFEVIFSFEDVFSNCRCWSFGGLLHLKRGLDQKCIVVVRCHSYQHHHQQYIISLIFTVCLIIYS